MCDLLYLVMHYRIEFKQYLARFKKIKKLVSAQNFELQLMNDVVTRQKVIALQTVETKVSSDLKIQFAIETEDLRCHNIAKFVAYVQEQCKQADQYDLYMVYEHGEMSLTDYLAVKSKTVKIGFLAYFLPRILMSLLEALQILHRSKKCITNVLRSLDYVILSEPGTINQCSWLLLLQFDKKVDLHCQILSRHELQELNRFEKESQGEVAFCLSHTLISAKQIFDKVGVLVLKVISWMRECDITLFTMDSSYQLMFSDIEIKNYLERAKIDKNLIPFVAIVDQLLFALRDDCVFEEGLNIVKQNLQQAGNMESLSARILQRSSPGKLIKGSRYIEESRYVEKSRYAEGGRYAKGGRDHSPPKPRISHQLRMKTVEQRISFLEETVLGKAGSVSEKVYSGGSKYRGELSGERREGYGIYYYMEGDVCGGKWSEDSLTQGIYLFGSGEMYEGTMKEGEKCGLGLYSYPSGNWYEGEWNHDQKWGKGELFVALTAELYEGNFVNGMKEGFGVQTWPKGEKYEGQFRRGMKQGKGILHQGGVVTRGTWHDDVLVGVIQLSFGNADKYTGEFNALGMHGSGIYRFKNNTVYEGDFVNGNKSGQCEVRFENGDIYRGQIRDDEFCGEGQYYYKQLEIRYCGKWLHGKQNGKGKLLLPRGIMVEGVWHDGELDESQAKLINEKQEQITGDIRSVIAQGLQQQQ